MSGIELPSNFKQFRSSIILMILAVGGIYYSTQISLEHDWMWWNRLIFGSSTVLFCLGGYYILEEIRHEHSIRKVHLEQEKAKRDALLKQNEETNDEVEAADAKSETDEVELIPFEDL